MVDFGGGRRWAIEVKLGEDTSPKAGFHEALKEVHPEHAFVINGGSESIDPGGGKVPAHCLSDALELFENAQ